LTEASRITCGQRLPSLAVPCGEELTCRPFGGGFFGARPYRRAKAFGMMAIHNDTARILTMKRQFLIVTSPIEDFPKWSDFFRGMKVLDPDAARLLLRRTWPEKAKPRNARL